MQGCKLLYRRAKICGFNDKIGKWFFLKWIIFVTTLIPSSMFFSNAFNWTLDHNIYTKLIIFTKQTIAQFNTYFSFESLVWTKMIDIPFDSVVQCHFVW